MAYWRSPRIVRRERTILDAARIAIETETEIPLEDGRPASALRHQVRQALASAESYPAEPWMKTLSEQIIVKVVSPTKIVLVPDTSVATPASITKLPTLLDAISQLMVSGEMQVPSVSFWVPPDADPDQQAEMFKDGTDTRWTVTRREDKDRGGGTLVTFSAQRRTEDHREGPSAFDLLT